jgi:hypothetical protein
MPLRKARKKVSPEMEKLEATKTLLVKVEDGGSEGKPEDLYYVAYESNADENDGLSNFENDEVLAVFRFDKFVRVKKETTIEAVELA